MLIVSSLLSLAAVAYDGLAVTAAGDIYQLDSSSADVALLNSTGLPMHCLARANDGRMWSFADVGGGVARLIQIDSVSGGTSTLTSLDLGGVARGASFDADGALFVLVRPLGGGADRLARLDMTTLALSDIGSTGLASLEDLCIAPEGRLYAWDSGPGGVNGAGLVELSRVTGVAVDIAPTGGSGDVLALAVDEVGELRGANSKLYSIERSTGVDQPISAATPISIEGFQYFAGMSRIDGALALERTGGLRRINTTTGAAGPIFATLSGNLVATTFLPKPSLLGDYLVFRDLGATTEVLRVDPSTGASTSLGSIALDEVRAAYYFPFTTVSELWVVTDGGPGQPDRRRKLGYPSLLVLPEILLAGFEDVVGMSVDYSRRHVGFDRTQGFFRVDLTLQSMPEDVTPGPTLLSGVTALRHDPQGRMFGAGSALHRVGVWAESASRIGSASLNDVIGLDFFAAGQLPTPTLYCSGSTNSLGCNTRLIGAGALHPSASEPGGFELQGLDVLSGKQGLLFYGLNGRTSSSFSSGLLCVKSPLRRTGVQNSGGAGACTGSFTLDFNARIASGVDPALAAGVKVNCQYWSRDPAAASTTHITNGYEFYIAP